MTNECRNDMYCSECGTGNPEHRVIAQSTPGPWEVDERCYVVRSPNLPLKAETGLGNGVVCVAVHSHADAALIARAPDLAAENEQLKAKLEIANEALYRTATRIRDLRDDLPLKDDKRSHELLVSIGIEIRENLKALTTHPARGEDGAR